MQVDTYKSVSCQITLWVFTIEKKNREYKWVLKIKVSQLIHPQNMKLWTHEFELWGCAQHFEGETG